LKTTWRFLVLIYTWAVLLVIALATARSWMPSNEGAALFLGVGFIGSVVLLTCFSLAAVGWALWSFRGRTSAEQRPAWLGLFVALITLALSTGYLLLLTGVIRR
jgi:flagellar basal body-associated protein FliL